MLRQTESNIQWFREATTSCSLF